jgi:hypothetical protein
MASTIMSMNAEWAYQMGVTWTQDGRDISSLLPAARSILGNKKALIAAFVSGFEAARSGELDEPEDEEPEELDEDTEEPASDLAAWIGTSWEGPDGTNTIVEMVDVDGELYFVAQEDTSTGQSRYRFPAANVEAVIRAERDRLLRLPGIKEKAERQRREAEEKQTREAEREARNRADFLDAFLETLSPRQAAKAEETLLRQVSVQGTFDPRGKHIDRLIAEGYVAKTLPKHGRVMWSPEEQSWITEVDLTKTALDYAEFVLRLLEDDTGGSETEEPETAEPERLYTYGATLRPPGIGAIPDGYVAFGTHPSFPRFGTVSYPFELDLEQRRHFDLWYIPDDLSEVQSYVSGIASRISADGYPGYVLANILEGNYPEIGAYEDFVRDWYIFIEDRDAFWDAVASELDTRWGVAPQYDEPEVEDEPEPEVEDETEDEADEEDEPEAEEPTSEPAPLQITGARPVSEVSIEDLVRSGQFDEGRASMMLAVEIERSNNPGYVSISWGARSLGAAYVREYGVTGALDYLVQLRAQNDANEAALVATGQLEAEVEPEPEQDEEEQPAPPKTSSGYAAWGDDPRPWEEPGTRPVDLRKPGRVGDIPDTETKLALELAIEIERAKDPNYVSVSWDSQETAQGYVNTMGLPAALDYMLLLRATNDAQAGVSDDDDDEGTGEGGADGFSEADLDLLRAEGDSILYEIILGLGLKSKIDDTLEFRDVSGERARWVKDYILAKLDAYESQANSLAQQGYGPVYYAVAEDELAEELITSPPALPKDVYVYSVDFVDGPAYYRVGLVGKDIGSESTHEAIINAGFKTLYSSEQWPALYPALRDYLDQREASYDEPESAAAFLLERYRDKEVGPYLENAFSDFLNEASVEVEDRTGVSKASTRVRFLDNFLDWLEEELGIPPWNAIERAVPDAGKLNEGTRADKEDIILFLQMLMMVVNGSLDPSANGVSAVADGLTMDAEDPGFDEAIELAFLGEKLSPAQRMLAALPQFRTRDLLGANTIISYIDAIEDASGAISGVFTVRTRLPGFPSIIYDAKLNTWTVGDELAYMSNFPGRWAQRTFFEDEPGYLYGEEIEVFSRGGKTYGPRPIPALVEDEDEDEEDEARADAPEPVMFDEMPPYTQIEPWDTLSSWMGQLAMVETDGLYSAYLSDHNIWFDPETRSQRYVVRFVTEPGSPSFIPADAAHQKYVGENYRMFDGSKPYEETTFSVYERDPFSRLRGLRFTMPFEFWVSKPAKELTPGQMRFYREFLRTEGYLDVSRYRITKKQWEEALRRPKNKIGKVDSPPLYWEFDRFLDWLAINHPGIVWEDVPGVYAINKRDDAVRFVAERD